MLQTKKNPVPQKRLVTLIVIAEEGPIEEAIRMLKPVKAVHNVKDVAITVQLSDVVEKGGFELLPQAEESEEGAEETNQPH